MDDYQFRVIRGLLVVAVILLGVVTPPKATTDD
jgi:hypothetical protein